MTESESEFRRRRAREVETLDRLSYITVFGPQFPPSHGTQIDDEIRGVLDGLSELISVARQERRPLLELAHQEAQQARALFAKGQDDEGLRLVQDALWHFKDWQSGKPQGTSFIAGPDGTVTKTSED